MVKIGGNAQQQSLSLSFPIPLLCPLSSLSFSLRLLRYLSVMPLSSRGKGRLSKWGGGGKEMEGLITAETQQ